MTKIFKAVYLPNPAVQTEMIYECQAVDLLEARAMCKQAHPGCEVLFVWEVVT